MRRHYSALPLVAASLCLPLAAQETRGEKTQFSVFHIVTLHSPVPTSFRRIWSICAGAEMRRSAVHALGDGATDVDTGASLESSFNSEGERSSLEAREQTSIEFRFYVAGKLAAPLPAGGDEKVFTAVLQDLEQRLKAKLYDEPMARDQHRLAELEDIANKLEQEHLQLRERILMVSGDGSADSATAALADLDKKRLDVELDLHTEEAVQERLQRMAQETQKRQEDLSKQSEEVSRKHDGLLGLIAAARTMLEGTKVEETERARQQLNELVREGEATQRAFQNSLKEIGRCVMQLDAIAEDARRGTLSIHRLTARLDVLQRLLMEQRKMAAGARAAMLERETAQARDDELKARLTAVRQRAEELRSKLDAVEPVRLEVWK